MNHLSKQGIEMKTLLRILLLIIAGVVLISAFNFFGTQQAHTHRIIFSDFINELQKDNVKSVDISGQDVTGTLQDDQVFSTRLVMPLKEDPDLLKTLETKGVKIKSSEPVSPSLLMHFLNLLPWIIVIVMWMYILKQRNEIKK